MRAWRDSVSLYVVVLLALADRLLTRIDPILAPLPIT